MVSTIDLSSSCQIRSASIGLLDAFLCRHRQPLAAMPLAVVSGLVSDTNNLLRYDDDEVGIPIRFWI
jgi:hypothetical protein